MATGWIVYAHRDRPWNIEVTWGPPVCRFEGTQFTDNNLHSFLQMIIFLCPGPCSSKNVEKISNWKQRLWSKVSNISYGTMKGIVTSNPGLSTICTILTEKRVCLFFIRKTYVYSIQILVGCIGICFRYTVKCLVNWQKCTTTTRPT